MTTQAPTHNPARPLVHHHGQVTPSRADLQVGDIADPNLIRLLGQDRQLPIRNTEEGMIGRVRAIETRGPSLKASFSHQPRHPILTDRVSQLPQRSGDPRAAIGLAARYMNPLNGHHQSAALLCPITRRPPVPGVVPGSAYLVHPAHHGNSVSSPVCLDEGEDFRFCSEANRMAFFRSSCSSLRIAYFFSNSRSRLSSATVCGSSFVPLATMAPSRTCLRHRDSMNGWMSSAAATS